MPLRVSTDHAAITAAIDRALDEDPVGATILGTMRPVLEPTAWSAVDGPRLAIRSGAGYPLLVRGPWRVGSAVYAQLCELARALTDLRGISGSVDVVDALAADIAADRPHERVAQRLFRCDVLLPPSGIVGGAVPADPADGARRSLVHRWFAEFLHEVGEHFGNAAQSADRALDEGTCWLWLDASGDAVSLATCRPVIAGSARVGPVYTPRAERGRGYGSAVTATATADVLACGGVPVLFTDLANPTSNKIYQLLGYRPVEDRAVWMFGSLQR